MASQNGETENQAKSVLVSAFTEKENFLGGDFDSEQHPGSHSKEPPSEQEKCEIDEQLRY